MQDGSSLRGKASSERDASSSGCRGGGQGALGPPGL